MIVFSKAGEIDKQRLFSLLALELKKNNQKVISFSFNYSEKYFYKKNGIESLEVNNEKILLNQKINFSNEEIGEMIRFEKEIRKDFNEKKWRELARNYLIFLEGLNKENKIKCAIMWNNSYLFDRILYFFCLKYNIKYFVMEQGYFRPFTLSFDSKGVNSEASIIKEINFYENQKMNLERYKRYLLKPELALKNSNKILYSQSKYNLLRFFEKLKLQKKRQIWDITEKNLFEFILKKRAIKKLKKYSKISEINSKYIFIPFQVEKDSQIILNSEKIKKMKELYITVAEAIINLNKNNKDKLKAVFKIHPMDEFLKIEEILELELKYQETILLTEGNTQELIKNSEAVITINSTIGIEALLEYKPVITLGEAFYSINGIAHYCDKLENLSKDLKRVLNLNVNKELIDKFLYYLRFEYFKEIYWRNPDEHSIKRIVKEILADE